jgi:two-component system sensor histidine kinase CiaH
MFKSARLKLTLFYLAAIVVMSLVLTIGSRFVAQHAFNDSNLAQRPGLSAMIRREVGLPLNGKSFNQFENHQEQSVQDELNLAALYINVVTFLIGGVISYWFAGRTLRPIQEAHETQTRFAADASHELRTPLTSMKTENEVFLRQKKFSEDDARDQINSNLEEIQRLEQLAANLLSLSSIIEPDQLPKTRIKAVTVAQLAVHQVKALHPKEIDRIKTDIEAVNINGHPESLAQILSIFLDNALKYSPETEPVKLIGINDKNGYSFMVEDNGPGIKPVDMPKIFERLYRGDKARSKLIEGHGLGLSLAKEIAKTNEIGLSVGNLPEGGARFTVSI